ncbi:unnamed protein product [Dicrocoelium dendriticum]|nr:unnamed protein product [Dicrocoelium dendriticum]
MRCTSCQQVCKIDGEVLQMSGNSSDVIPPLKHARLSFRHLAVPILIVSVGKCGIFDARHGPCVITSSTLTFKAKVEGEWSLVCVKPSDIQALVFCEELQVIFLKPRETFKYSLTALLKLNASRTYDPASMKWIILVLGDHMNTSPDKHVSISQMELFASSVRTADGFCKMDFTLMDTRKLLFDCGLRLPRAEDRLRATTNLVSEPPPAPSLTQPSSVRIEHLPGTGVGEVHEQPNSVSQHKTDGGLLTNVLNTLSSAGMHLFGHSIPSSRMLTEATPNKENGKQDNQLPAPPGDDSDDLIILSEESTCGDRSTVQTTPGQSSAILNNSPNSSPDADEQSFKFDYQPPGSTDSVTLTQADLDCLAPGGLLNDAIINFYLKYLYFEQLTESQRRATYLFNCFFYSRLAGAVSSAPPGTVSSGPCPAAITANAGVSDSSVARHSNVAKWTRRVDLFCKDYVIIPINEASHWFLGLVCYPWMAGMVSYTALYRAAAFDLCHLTEEFLDVDNIQFINALDSKNISQEPLERRPTDPKGAAFDRWRRRRLAWLRNCGINAMPCILLFDSLPCQTRVTNLHVIRDYLQVEWNMRRCEQDGPLYFNKDTIRGFSPRVPSQSNLVDCGIYLLHYVEMFFKQPVQSYTKDYFQNEMASWFTEDTVSQKRTEIQQLLLQLHQQHQHP